MASLISKIPKVLFSKGRQPFLANIISPNNMSQTVSSIAGKLKAYVSSMNGTYSNFVLSFVSDPSVISDALVEGKEITLSAWNDFVVEVSDDYVTDALDALKQLGFDNLVEGQALHVTDSHGRDIVLCPTDEVIDGCRGIVASTLYPTDITDFLIYEKDGKKYFSNVITAFNQVDGDALDIDTLTEALDALLQYEGFSGDYANTDRARAVKLCESVSLPVLATATTEDLCIEYLNSKGILDVQDYTSEMIDYAKDHFIEPKNISFLDVVRDISQLSGINQLTADVCNAMLLGNMSVADILPIINDYVNNGSSATISYALGAKTAFLSGGAYGLLSYIGKGWADANDLSVSNGTLQFTDNSTFMPVEFSAGIVSAIGEFMSGVVTAAATIINPIVGAISAIVTSIGAAFYKGVKYAESLERCSLNLDGAYDFAAPHAFMQWTEVYSSADLFEGLNPDMYDMLLNQGAAFQCEIPGGYLFFGRGNVSRDADGAISRIEIRFEFHPEYVGASANVIREWSHPRNRPGEPLLDITYHNLHALHPRCNTGQWQPNDGCFVITPFKSWGEWAESICAFIENNNDKISATKYFTIANQSDGQLSVSDTLRIQRNIRASVGLFVLWMIHQTGIMPVDMMSDNRIFIAAQYWGTGGAGLHANGIAYGAYRNQIGLLQIVGSALIENMLFYFDAAQGNGSYTTYDSHWATISATLDIHTYDGDVVTSDCDLDTHYPAGYLGRPDFTGLTNDALYACTKSNWNDSGVPSEIGDNLFSYIINNKLYHGIASELPANYASSLVTPKYNTGSVWRFIVIASIATVATAAVATVIGLAARKAITAKRAKLTAEVYAASEAYAKNPTDGNAYKAYKKLVRKNNFFTSIFGGNKYNYNSYWDGDTSGQTEATSSLGAIVSDYVDFDEQGKVNPQPVSNDVLYALISGLNGAYGNAEAPAVPSENNNN